MGAAKAWYDFPLAPGPVSHGVSGPGSRSAPGWVAGAGGGAGGGGASGGAVCAKQGTVKAAASNVSQGEIVFMAGNLGSIVSFGWSLAIPVMGCAPA